MAKDLIKDTITQFLYETQENKRKLEINVLAYLEYSCFKYLKMHFGYSIDCVTANN